WRELLTEIRRKFSISGPVDLCIAANPGPLTTGIFSQTILLPRTAADWSLDRRRLVLAHEMAHIKRRSTLEPDCLRCVLVQSFRLVCRPSPAHRTRTRLR